MVFKRYEMKYLLDKRQKESILKAMEPFMELDGYGRHIIKNIYYDTNQYRIVRRSLEHPVYKEKLRVRAYGATGPDEKVFVELKKKYEGIVYKRRIHIQEAEAMDYLAGKRTPQEQNQVTAEIDYFIQFYEGLRPKVFLSYEREAYDMRDGSEFRVTFDENILWREEELTLRKGPYGTPILKPGQTLMELKTPGGIPLWMVKVLTAEGIRKTSFSKYGSAYATIMKYKTGRGETIYA